jgi:hypothetical protein
MGGGGVGRSTEFDHKAWEREQLERKPAPRSKTVHSTGCACTDCEAKRGEKDGRATGS